MGAGLEPSAIYDRGAVMNAIVRAIEPKEAEVELAPEVMAVLKASEISVDRVEDARNVLKIDQEVEVKIISIDRKNRVIAVSIKSKDVDEERTAVRDHRKNEADRPAATTIGDLIKAQMDQDR